MSLGYNINYASDFNSMIAAGNYQIIYIGIVALVIILIFFYTRNQQNSCQSSPWVSFNNLTPQMQAMVNSYIGFASAIDTVPPMTFVGVPIQTNIQHAIINNIKCGVVISTSTKNIYLTYYEFLNWLLNISVYPTLSVPERTVVNNVITDSITVGHAISTSVSGMNILPLTQQTTPSISYTNTLGAPQTISTLTAPTLTITPSTGNGATQGDQWTTFSSLSLPMQSIVTGYINIVSAIDIMPHIVIAGNSYRLTIQHITINGVQYGVLLSTAVKAFYVTYCEFLNWIINTPSYPTLSIPDRMIANNTITDSTTAGYSISISSVGIGLTSLAQQTTSSIRYIDALGASQTVSTTVLQTLS
jgi:hypothetical protein